MKIFKLDLREERVVLESRKHGKREYVIREMTGKARDAYLTHQAKNMSIEGDGVKKIRSFNGMFSQLLSRCIYDGETNELVPEKEILDWPAATIEALFDIANNLSSLTEESQEEAGNASEASAISGTVSPTA